MWKDCQRCGRPHPNCKCEDEFPNVPTPPKIDAGMVLAFAEGGPVPEVANPVEQILSATPEQSGTLSAAAQALNLPMHEGMLGDPVLNGEHVVGHMGIRNLLEGKLSDRIIAAADKAEHPDLAGVAGLGEVEKTVNAHADGVGSHARALFDGSSAKPSAPSFLSPDSHSELLERLHNLAGNPTALIDELSGATQTLHAVAPQIAQSAQATAARAVQFLATKAPQLPVGPFDDSHEPSPSEISTFHRYLSVVEDPKLALRQVKDGTLVPETVETLQNVYPRLYDEMRTSILASLNPSVPYQTKMALSDFLGQPLDESLSSDRVASLQKAFAGPAPAQPMPGKTKSSVKGLSKLDVAQRTSLAPNDEA